MQHVRAVLPEHLTGRARGRGDLSVIHWPRGFLAARQAPFEEECVSSSAGHRYILTHLHAHTPVGTFCVHPCPKDPRSLCGSNNDQQPLTLSREPQLLAPRQNVVYTQCFTPGTVSSPFLFFVCFACSIGCQGHRPGRKYYTEQQAWATFVLFIFSLQSR